jgi:hypothetical protein
MFWTYASRLRHAICYQLHFRKNWVNTQQNLQKYRFYCFFGLLLLWKRSSAIYNTLCQVRQCQKFTSDSFLLQVTVERICNGLLFVNSGWLVEIRTVRVCSLSNNMIVNLTVVLVYNTYFSELQIAIHHHSLIVLIAYFVRLLYPQQRFRLNYFKPPSSNRLFSVSGVHMFHSFWGFSKVCMLKTVAIDTVVEHQLCCCV